jgi:ribosomal protein L11 methyltransferase
MANNYIKVSVVAESQEVREMVMALLSEVGYDTFEEDGVLLHAYIAETDFDVAGLEAVLAGFNLGYVTESIEQKNWNEIWEAGFEPVVVEDFCTIRAHFHNVGVKTQHEIVITPKMSFGTGHHATTQLMVMGMAEMEMTGRSVLDFGTGTGVLAILAGKLGATEVLGIDNDEWAVENAIENLERNSATGIEIMCASVEGIPDRQYDTILANINRHILLATMPVLYSRLNEGGVLLMSGLLVEDEQVMVDSIVDAGLKVEKISVRNGWISILALKC